MTRPVDWRRTMACGPASYVRGELAAMRAHAAAFPRRRRGETQLARGRRRASLRRDHALVRRRVREARDHLELALALFQPGRDDDLAFRFGQDAGVAAMADLAQTLWPLGDVDRAASLMEGLEARIARLTTSARCAFGRFHLATFEMRRGDRRELPAVPRTRPARSRARLAHFWRVRPVSRRLGRPTDSGAPGGGLEGMRRGVELLRERNALVFDGIMKIALAEAEAAGGRCDRALVIVDEALATSNGRATTRSRPNCAACAAKCC